jgi:hypothetical protein
LGRLKVRGGWKVHLLQQINWPDSHEHQANKQFTRVKVLAATPESHTLLQEGGSS